MTKSPFFDKAIFMTLRSELGEEETVEVLEVFLSDTARKLEIMTSAMQDRSTIKRESHSIKSSAATFGFVEFSAFAREIECNIEYLSPSLVPEFVKTLGDAFERVSDFARANLLNTGAELA